MPGAATGAVSVTTADGIAGGGNFTVTATLFPAIQQGAKLVGTGSVGTTVNQGNAVAVSADGNTAVVGGFADNNLMGAIWIYSRTGTTWSQQGAKLVGTGSLGQPEQGFSVAIGADGNTVIEGGFGDNGGMGAAWVFTRSNGIWMQQGAKLPLGVLTPVDFGDSPPAMGYSVALSADGNTALVGALNVSNNESDPGMNGLPMSGAGAIYTRTDGVWQQQVTLLGAATSDNASQGWSVALSADGNTAIVGGFDETGTGVFGDRRSMGIHKKRQHLANGN